MAPTGFPRKIVFAVLYFSLDTIIPTENRNPIYFFVVKYNHFVMVDFLMSTAYGKRTLKQRFHEDLAIPLTHKCFFVKQITVIFLSTTLAAVPKASHSVLSTQVSSAQSPVTHWKPPRQRLPRHQNLQRTSQQAQPSNRYEKHSPTT